MITIVTDFLHYFKSLDETAKQAIAAAMPVKNPEGRFLSEQNCAFLAFQSKIPFTTVAGYRQWIKNGRCVKKGQHGNYIFIPAMKKSKGEDGSVQEELDRFLMARVFDITQTFEIKDPAAQEQEVAAEAAF